MRHMKKTNKSPQKKAAINKPETPEVLTDEWLDITAKRARLSKDIKILDLIFIMAEDETYNDILSKIWEALELNNKMAVRGMQHCPSSTYSRVRYRGWTLGGFDPTNTEIGTSTALERTYIWYFILSRMAGTNWEGRFYVVGLPIIRTLLPETDDGERPSEYAFIELDDFAAYLRRIEEVHDLSIPLPARLFPDENKKPIQRNKVFPCEPGTQWEDIKITLVANDMVRIKTPQGEGRFTYHELGMADKRAGDKPKLVWGLLVVFARRQGVLSPSDSLYSQDRVTGTANKYKGTICDATKRLNKHLKEVFGIDESIYKWHYRKYKKYETKIFFSDETQVASY